jgi:hypothetical protein
MQRKRNSCLVSTLSTKFSRIVQVESSEVANKASIKDPGEARMSRRCQPCPTRPAVRGRTFRFVPSQCLNSCFSHRKHTAADGDSKSHLLRASLHGVQLFLGFGAFGISMLLSSVRESGSCERPGRVPKKAREGRAYTRSEGRTPSANTKRNTRVLCTAVV